MTDLEKEFKLDNQKLAELLEDIAEALQDEAQLNLDFENKKLSQPLGSENHMRIYQDEAGTEIGFHLSKQED
ncbi:MAG: hypothetical protein J07AB43_16560 [Candidatus Nanosalina sp. J07AB43]|jgi:hypothetical protein|nr:MAG: hypothetical protein J07AB43_16560 [Candidatus Nanosalina sp. J07AB43]